MFLTRLNLASTIGDGANWVALSHVSPDGDALASLSAVAVLCPAMTVVLHDSAPPVIARNAGHLRRFWNEEEIAAELRAATGVLILDCSEPARTGLSPELLAEIEGKAVVIDHHTTDVPYGKTFRDPTAPSTTALIFGLFRERMTPEAATWLYYGLLTDTIGFRIAEVTDGVYWLAASLLNAGADHAVALNRAFFSATLAEIQAGARALIELIQPIGEGKALIALDRGMPADAGYAAMRRAQEAADIGCVVLLTEKEDANGQPVVRGSVRARAPFTALPFAARYGGGGHRMAAGFTIPGTLAEVLPQVAAALRMYTPE